MNKDIIIEIGRKVKNKEMTWKQAAQLYSKQTGDTINGEQFRGRYRRYETEPIVSEQVVHENTYNEVHNADGTIDIVKTLVFDKDTIKTPEDILNLFGYDIDCWEVKEWSIGKWETFVKGEGLQEQSTIRAKLKPKEVVLSKRDIIDITKEVISKDIKPIKLPKQKKITTLDDTKLDILSIADLHLGRVCEKIETGTEYNLDIACDKFNGIIDELLSLQSQRHCGELLYTIGNDLFNVDNANYTTTKGTQMQNSASYKEMYKRGLELQINALKRMRECFNRINVLLVQGNHDEVLDYTLYLALQQIFKDDDVIQFSTDYKKTQCFVFGNNSIYFDHGDTNYKRLMQTLPSMFYKEYGSTENRYALLHHLHSQQAIDELTGITAYRLSTLAPTDNYEYKNKFGSVNGSQALFELDKESGLSNITYIKK